MVNQHHSNWQASLTKPVSENKWSNSSNNKKNDTNSPKKIGMNCRDGTQLNSQPNENGKWRKAGLHLNECNDSAEAARVGGCVLGSNAHSPSADLGRIG